MLRVNELLLVLTALIPMGLLVNELAYAGNQPVCNDKETIEDHCPITPVHPKCKVWGSEGSCKNEHENESHVGFFKMTNKSDSYAAPLVDNEGGIY